MLALWGGRAAVRGILRAWARARPSLWMLLFAALGITLVLANSRYGPVLGSDSVVYLGAAENLVAGRGISWLGPEGDIRPLVIFAPLYPVVLAAFRALGLPTLAVGHSLSAMLFGLNVALVWLLVERLTRDRGLAALAALTALFSRSFFFLHTGIVSEPLFFLFSLLGLAALWRGAEKPAAHWDLAAAASLGLAALTRYAGILLIAGAGLWLLWVVKGSLGQRAGRAARFAALAAAPVLIWMMRNRSLGGSSTFRELAFAPPPARLLAEVLDVVTFWFLPQRIPLVFRGLMLGALFAAGALLWLLLQRRGGESAQRYSRALLLLLLLSVAYAFGLVAIRSIFVPRIDMNQRMLEPIHLFLLLLFYGLMGWALVSAGVQQKWLRRVLGLLAVGFTAVYLVRGTIGALELQQDGVGFSSRAWQQSPLVNVVGLIPPDRPIYTNEVEALFLLAGRTAYRLPFGCVGDDPLLEPQARADCRDPEYVEWVRRMRARLAEEQGVIALFDTIWEQPYAPQVPRLVEGLEVLSSQGDGMLYVADREQWPDSPHW